jgi:hypothetical protein
MTNEDLFILMSDPKYLIEKDVKLDDAIADSMLREFKTSYWNLLDHLVGKIELKTGDKYIYNCTYTKPEFMLVRIVGKGWILVDSKGSLWEHSLQSDLEIKLELFQYFTKVES